MRLPKLWIPENNSNVSMASLSSDTSNIPTLSVGLSGYYHVELKDSITGNIKFSGSFPNVLTDRYMDGIGAGSGSFPNFVALALGSGSTTPLSTDTQLAGEFGTRSTTNAGISDVIAFRSGSLPTGTFWSFTRTRFFDVGISTGTIAEFGWYPSTSPTAMLLNRSLIRDLSGTPTTIVKSPADELRVGYEYRVALPVQSQSFNIDFGPTSHVIKFLPYRIDALLSTILRDWGVFCYATLGTWDGPICVVYSSISSGSNPSPYQPSYYTGSMGSYSGPTINGSATPETASYGSYVTGTYYKDASFVIRASNGTVNAYPSGVAGLGFSPWYAAGGLLNPAWIGEISPPVSKPDTHQLKFTVRYSWYRSATTE